MSKGKIKQEKPKRKERVRKISERDFWRIMRANAGIYARVAREIEKEFGGTFTRQCVRVRAEKNAELLYDIEEESLDNAEEGLQALMRSTVPSIRLKAIEMFLRTKGKRRGYIEKQEVDLLTKHNITVEIV